MIDDPITDDELADVLEKVAEALLTASKNLLRVVERLKDLEPTS